MPASSTTPSVLIDGFHLRMRGATGIGSYARTLTDNLRGLGCSVSLLFGQRVAGNGGSPLAISSQVFGATRDERPAAESRLYRMGRTFEAVFRHRARAPVSVPFRHADLAAMENALPEIDHALNSDRLFDRAAARFAMRHRHTEVRRPPGTDAVHWTYPVPLAIHGAPNIYTVHDVIPVRYPHLTIDRNGRAAALMSFVARRADLVVTVSEASKRDIVDYLKVPEERVAVTYQSVPPMPHVSADDSARITRDVYGIEPGKFILFLGAIEPKKNLRRLIEAHVVSGVEMPLVIAGAPGWNYEADLQLIDTVTAAQRRTAAPGAPIRERVRHLGYLPRRHVVALLQSAGIFAFPSICEGFGLPVLEAMTAGVPVLTSNTTSLPEVVGDAARLVDPLDVPSIARGLRDLASDAEMRREYASRGLARARVFSCDFYKTRLAEAYRRVGLEMPGEPARSAA